MAKETVLVVEDEENLTAALRYNLEKEGFAVLTAADGQTGLEGARQARPDLVVLDLMLPVLDGLELCRILRRESAVPILVLTARADEVDRVIGLEIGADDYVTKPFSMRELVARVRALLRRARMLAEQTSNSTGPASLQLGGLEMDLDAHVARLDGRELDLKPKEFQLLALLMYNRGRAFSRDRILERVWGHDFIGDSRTVDVHIRWLRQKIEREPGSPRAIITVRGVGYRFEG